MLRYRTTSLKTAAVYLCNGFDIKLEPSCTKGEKTQFAFIIDIPDERAELHSEVVKGCRNGFDVVVNLGEYTAKMNYLHDSIRAYQGGKITT